MLKHTSPSLPPRLQPQGPRVRKALNDLIGSLQTEITASVSATASAEAGAASSGAMTTAAAGNGVPAAVSGSHLPETGAAGAEEGARAGAGAAPVAPGAPRTSVEGGMPAPPRAPERRCSRQMQMLDSECPGFLRPQFLRSSSMSCKSWTCIVEFCGPWRKGDISFPS